MRTLKCTQRRLFVEVEVETHLEISRNAWRGSPSLDLPSATVHTTLFLVYLPPEEER